MAFTTTIQDVSAYLRGVDKYEQKLANIGALNAFMDDTRLAIPDFNKLLNQYKNPNGAAKFAVMQKETVTVTNVRALSFSPVEGTSAYYSIVFATIVGGISLAPNSFAGNDVAYGDALRKKLEALELAFLKQMDTLAVAAIDAGKTQVDASGGVPFAFGTNAYNLTLAQKDELLYQMPVLMAQNDIETDGLNYIGSASLQAYVSEQLKYGANNSENKDLFLANNGFYFSNRITNAAGKRVTGYALPKGTLAMAQWIEDDCKRGVDLGTQKWNTLVLPKSGVEVGIYEVLGGVDRSAIDGTGFERAYFQKWQAALDVAFVVPYISDYATISAPIHKFTVATT